MHRLIIAVFLVLTTNQLVTAQVEKSQNRTDGQIAIAEAFHLLVNKTWYAEGTWEMGQSFRQAITFSYGVQRNVVIAESKGYINQEQTDWGDRNHGVRYWDAINKRLAFTEYDAFGSVTTGHLEVKDSNLYYHYEYLGEVLTDAWERVSPDRYRFRVGQLENGEWTRVVLDTYFTTSPFELATAEDTTTPYEQIPDAPDEYNACTVVARMIDGLGFRYYWATKGLRPIDLDYKPSPEGRTSAETLDHLYGLAAMIHNTVMKLPNVRPAVEHDWTFVEQREKTLRLLKVTSDKLRLSHPAEMEGFKIIFQRGELISSFPFWNNLNGPIGDALWHTGQIVLLRRASGNPLDSNVNVFRGTRG